jgi:hypothetical protein
MKTSVKTKQFFFTLNITYYMQAVAVAAFALVVAFLISQNTQPPIEDNNTWVTLVSVILISALVMAYFVFRFLLSKINPSLRLQEKMPRYARAILVRSALIEIPGLLASIAAYLTGSLHFLAISLLIFLIFVIMRPTRNTISQDLNLSPKDKGLLEDDSAVISEVNS